MSDTIQVDTTADALCVMCALAAKEITPEESDALLPESSKHLPGVIAQGRKFAAINRLARFVADHQPNSEHVSREAC